MVRVGPLFVIAACLSAGTAWGQQQQPDALPPIAVETTVSQTAIWVGDHLTYTIEIRCPPGTDILADDISRDRLQVTGLEIVTANQQREVRDDGTIVHRALFRLTSYVSDGSPVRIDPQPVRYYVNTAGRPVDALVPADEVHLPVVDIAVRSTLPSADLSGIRDALTTHQLPAGMRWVTPAGVVVVALALAPVLLGLTGAVARVSRPQRVTHSTRRNRQRHRQTLAEIRAVGLPDDVDARRDVCDRLNALIRDQLADYAIPAHGLTAEEVEKKMEGRITDPAASEVADILRACERASYGGPGQVPGADVLTRALETTDRFLLARFREAR